MPPSDEKSLRTSEAQTRRRDARVRRETIRAIVAWLRAPATAIMRHNAGPLVFAAAIERGEAVSTDGSK